MWDVRPFRFASMDASAWLTLMPTRQPVALLNPQRLPSRLLDIVGNVWLGCALLALVFIYSSIGSAVPPLRQGALAEWLGAEWLRFEKSEITWFNWWPFQVLVGALCVSMVVSTLRFIPLTVPRLGVWTIHSGIIILAIASVFYFGRKIEGDAVVFRSKAFIEVPGESEPAELLIRPGASITTGPPDRAYQVSVSRINPNYEILSGDDKGKRTQSIWLNVQPPGDEPTFIRVLLAGFPQYTEDVKPTPQGPQRAKKLTGEALIDKSLKIRLAPEPTEYYYHAHTAAIYSRPSPYASWDQHRLHDMPRYYEHISSQTRQSTVWASPEMQRRAGPGLNVRAGSISDTSDSQGEFAFRVTDYLPYADLSAQWIAGGDALNPVLSYRLQRADTIMLGQLIAFDESRSQARAGGYTLHFAWADSQEERASLLNVPSPFLLIRIESLGVERRVDLSLLADRESVAIEGTPYRIGLKDAFPAGAAGGDTPAFALVEIHRVATDERDGTQFSRVVVAGSEVGGHDLDEDMMPMEGSADEDIKLLYRNPSANRVLMVGGPEVSSGDDQRVDVLVTSEDGSHERHTLDDADNRSLTLAAGTRLIVENVIPHARRELQPRITPLAQRAPRQQVGDTMSLIGVEVTHRGETMKVWLPFNRYVFENQQYAQPGRFRYQPRTVTFSNGRSIDLLYSRWRDSLPAAVILERFKLETYPGGDQPKDYISEIRFVDDAEPSDIVEVKSNHPAHYGDLWFFQAQWDPGVEAHTVLGVGNRVAVGWMLAGTCISIAGMIYAFYVKPILLRRGSRGAQARPVPVSNEPTMQEDSDGIDSKEPQTSHA
jgi:hypothetical protein